MSVRTTRKPWYLDGEGVWRRQINHTVVSRQLFCSRCNMPRVDTVSVFVKGEPRRPQLFCAGCLVPSDQPTYQGPS